MQSYRTFTLYERLWFITISFMSGGSFWQSECRNYEVDLFRLKSDKERGKEICRLLEMVNRDAFGEGKGEGRGGKIKQEARIFEVPQPSGVCESALCKLRKSSSQTRGAPRVNGIGSYVEPVVRTDVLRRPRVVVASYVGLLLRLAEPRRAGLADKAHRAAPCLPGPDSPSRTHLLHLAHHDRVPEPTRRFRLRWLPHSAGSQNTTAPVEFRTLGELSSWLWKIPFNFRVSLSLPIELMELLSFESRSQICEKCAVLNFKKFLSLEEFSETFEFWITVESWKDLREFITVIFWERFCIIFAFSRGTEIKNLWTWNRYLKIFLWDLEISAFLCKKKSGFRQKFYKLFTATRNHQNLFEDF